LIDVRWQVIAYLLASILLQVVTIRLLAARRTSLPWAHRLNRGWAAALMRFIYYVGFPYLTLVLGVIPSSYLGLVGLEHLPTIANAPGAGSLLSQVRAALSLLLLEWLPGVGRMAGLAALMGLLLGVAWFAYGRARRRSLGDAVAALASIESPSPASFSQTAYAAIHWSFYRAGLWVLVGDLYVAAVCGMVLVGLEWLLSEAGTRAIRPLQAADALAVEASLLVTTATLFYFVPNLWLIIPVHWLLALLSWRVLA
jgi:cbb3-type cytochrome oxidase subunit 3